MLTSENKTSVLDAARLWAESGASVVRVATDGSKRPHGNWKQAQQEAADTDTVHGWFANGHPGVGVVCGAVSGGLTMLELEGRAYTDEYKQRLREALRDEPLGADAWRRILNGYYEFSPSRGAHFFYRRADGQAARNTQLARNANGEVMIETRGEGGFVVVAPSHGAVHPSGKPWKAGNGTPGEVATITAEEEQSLFSALFSLDDSPPPEPLPVDLAEKRANREASDGAAPGDDFNTRGTWREVFDGTGWQVVGQHNGGLLMRKPDGRNGDHQAVAGGAAGDLFVCWSTSVPEFDAERGYSKFRVYALLHHAGDFAAAAKALGEQGYGQQREAGAHLAAVASLPEFAAMTAGNNALQANPGPPATRRLKTRKFGQIKAERVRWLWDDMVPLGELTVIAARPSLGKSTVANWIAARASKGELPGDVFGQPTPVLYFASEENVGTTTAPRFALHGGDLDAAELADGIDLGEEGDAAFSLDGAADVLREHVAATGTRLIVFDVLKSFTGGVDEQKPGEVRRIMQRLADIAHKQDVAIVAVMHFRKNPSQADDPLDAISGTSEYGEVVRHALGLARLSGGQLGIGCIKSNIAQSDWVESYAIGSGEYETEDGATGSVSVFERGQRVDGLSARDMLRQGDGDTDEPEDPATVADSAKRFALKALSGGPMKCSDFRSQLCNKLDVKDRQAKKYIAKMSREGIIGTRWEESLDARAYYRILTDGNQ